MRMRERFSILRSEINVQKIPIVATRNSTPLEPQAFYRDMILLWKNAYHISFYLMEEQLHGISRVKRDAHSRIGGHKSDQSRIRGLPATREFGRANENVSVDVVKLIFILAGIQRGSCASFSADNAARGMIISFRKPQTPARFFRRYFFIFIYFFFSFPFSRGLEGMHVRGRREN